MAQQDQNGLGAMMAAQGELSSLNAARAQNSQAEQAFLQQQQAANAVMMQAAQIGTSGGLGQQVGAMNPQTQALLAQYGINGAAPQPGKTTSTNKTTQSGGNIKIENNTTTNNDIKIVNPPSQGGGDGGNQAKFQTWLSNSFAKQNQEYEVQRRAFAKRDRDLEKQSNKMMRELEKSTSTLGEKLNPKTWAAANGDQTKKVLGILLLTLAPTLIKPITDKLNDIFGFFNGEGGDDNDSKFEKKIKKILGFTQDDYDKKKGIGEKIGEIIGDKISRIEDTLKQQIDDRREAIASIEKPKRRLNGDKDAKILWRLGDWMSYLGKVIPAALGGSKGRMDSISDEIKDLGKEEITRDVNEAWARETKKEENISSGNYFLTNEDWTLGGKLKEDQATVRKSQAIVANHFETGKITENSATIHALMSENKRIAQSNGEIPLGTKEDADKFLEPWGWSTDLLIKAGETDGKTYILERKLVLVIGTLPNGIAISKVFEESSSELSEAKKGKVQTSYVLRWFLTSLGFNKIEEGLPFRFGEGEDLQSFNQYLSIKQKEKTPDKEISFGEAEELYEDHKEMDSQHNVHQAKIEHIQTREGASKTFEENFKDLIIDPLVGLGKDTVKKARESFVTSEYGKIRNLFGNTREHKGVDLRAETGTEVYAVSDGKVSRNGWDPGGYGKWIEITHEDGITTRYAHLSEKNVKKGDEVKAGDVIGLSGNTGSSTGPHLHYEVRKNNEPIDPGSLDEYHFDKALIPGAVSKEDPEDDKRNGEQDTNKSITEIKENELVLDNNLGVTAKQGDLLVSYDKNTYDQVISNGGNISDLSQQYYQVNSDGTVEVADLNETQKYFADKRTELLGINYKDEVNPKEIYLGRFYISLKSKKELGISDIAFNQLMKDGSHGQLPYISYNVLFSTDFKKICRIKLNQSFDTKRQISPNSNKTYYTGTVLYDENNNWGFTSDRTEVEKVCNEFGTTLNSCHGVNPICTYLGIGFYPEAQQACSRLMKLLQNLKQDKNTGEFLLGEKELDDKDYDFLKSLNIFENIGPNELPANIDQYTPIPQILPTISDLTGNGQTNILGLEGNNNSSQMIAQFLRSGKTVAAKAYSSAINWLSKSNFIRGVKTGYGDGDVVQSSQSSGTTTSTTDTDTQTPGVTIVDGGTVHNTYNTTINQYGTGNNPTAPTNS